MLMHKAKGGDMSVQQRYSRGGRSLESHRSGQGEVESGRSDARRKGAGKKEAEEKSPEPFANHEGTHRRDRKVKENGKL